MWNKNRPHHTTCASSPRERYWATFHFDFQANAKEVVPTKPQMQHVCKRFNCGSNRTRCKQIRYNFVYFIDTYEMRARLQQIQYNATAIDNNFINQCREHGRESVCAKQTVAWKTKWQSFHRVFSIEQYLGCEMPHFPYKHLLYVLHRRHNHNFMLLNLAWKKYRTHAVQVNIIWAHTNVHTYTRKHRHLSI